MFDSKSENDDAASPILVSVNGKVGLIQFNRPEARNAINDAVLSATREAMQNWEMDDNIHCVILTGDDKAFCAGGDVRGSAVSDLGNYAKYRSRYSQSEWHNFMRFLSLYTKPVIAAVEGYALGGGLEIALRCDFAIGSKSAKLGLTEAALGMFPILGGAWLLEEAVGPRKAKEMLFTATRVDADEALLLGLINHLVDIGEAVNKAYEVAKTISENAPLAVMAGKQAINRARLQSFEDALTSGGDLSALLLFSEDRAEGRAAFREKRKPDFKGQ